MILDEHIAAIKHGHACSPAIDWLRAEDRTWESAYRDADRGDWMLWFAQFVGVEANLITLASCDCAELALPMVTPGDDRPRIAIETKRRHLGGLATDEELAAAEAAAWEAARAAAEAAAWAAAWSAAEAAAWSAARAAAGAAAGVAAEAAAGAAAWSAARAAAWSAARAAAGEAAGVAAEAAAWATMHLRCAEAVRARIPWSVFEAAMRSKICQVRQDEKAQPRPN